MTFSTTTTFVNTGLGTEKGNRLEENDVFQYPVSIASTVVNEFQVVSKELDLGVLGEIQPILNDINQKKRQLVELGQIAAGPFQPGVFPPICGLFSDSDDIDNDVNSGNKTIQAVQGSEANGTTTTPAVAYSIIRGDYVRIRRYPYLESREAPNDKALDGEKFPILTTGNAGQGKEDILFTNSKYTDPDAGITYYVTDDEGNWNVTGFDGEEGDTFGRYYTVDSSAPPNSVIKIPGNISSGLVFRSDDLYTKITSYLTGIQTGHWYSGISTTYVEWNTRTGQIKSLSFDNVSRGDGTLSVDASQACAGIAASQTAIENDIDSLRSGLGNYFVSANTTKLRKHGAQLQLWTAERVKTRNTEESEGAIDFPRNIETTIPAVESVDSQLPTNTNTADKTTITADSTTLTVDSK